MALDDGSAQADSNTDRTPKLPSDVLSLLTDVHAHPTDDPRLSGSGGVPLLAQRLADEVRIGRLCAVASNTADQSLVRELKREFQTLQDNKGLGTGLDLRACFGEPAGHDCQERGMNGSNDDVSFPFFSILIRLPSLVLSHNLS